MNTQSQQKGTAILTEYVRNTRNIETKLKLFYNSGTDPVQDIPVERTIKHPMYSSSKKTNDIALLRLRSPADTTKKNVKTICLPTEEENQIERIDEQAREKMLIAGIYELYRTF